MNPLSIKPFRRYLTARAVSNIGSAMTPVALAFAVLQLTHSPRDLSYVLTAAMIPTLALLLIGGGMADRVGQAVMLRLTHLGSGLSQAGVAACVFTKQPVGYLIALAFVNGAIQAFTRPALSGIVPQLVPAEGVQKANSLLASTANATKIIGPSAAGLLVATVGGGWAIAIDAASFFVAAGFLLLVPVADIRRKQSGSRLFADLREGWVYFRSTPWIWSVTIGFTVVNLVQMGVWQVLGPVLAQGTIGAGGWGAALSCRAAGALAMSVLMIRLTVRRPLFSGLMLISVAALPLVLLGLRVGTAALAASALAAGMVTSYFTVNWDSALHTHVPIAMMSRVNSYDELGSFGAIPIGQLSVIPLASAFGAGHVAVAGGILFALAMLAPLSLASVRRLENVRSAPEAASAGAPATLV